MNTTPYYYYQGSQYNNASQTNGTPTGNAPPQYAIPADGAFSNASCASSSTNPSPAGWGCEAPQALTGSPSPTYEVQAGLLNK